VPKVSSAQVFFHKNADAVVPYAVAAGGGDTGRDSFRVGRRRRPGAEREKRCEIVLSAV